jgi:hypothetical protein
MTKRASGLGQGVAAAWSTICMAICVIGGMLWTQAHLTAQPRQLLLLSLDERVAIVGRWWRAQIGHMLVMPEERTLYRCELLDRRRSRAATR